MPFEIALPRNISASVLKRAGLSVGAYVQHTMDAAVGSVALMKELILEYNLAEPAVGVTVTPMEMTGTWGAGIARLTIACTDPQIERRIHESLSRYAIENDGELVA